MTAAAEHNIEIELMHASAVLCLTEALPDEVELAQRDGSDFLCCAPNS